MEEIPNIAIATPVGEETIYIPLTGEQLKELAEQKAEEPSQPLPTIQEILLRIEKLEAR